MTYYPSAADIENLSFIINKTTGLARRTLYNINTEVLWGFDWTVDMGEQCNNPALNEAIYQSQCISESHVLILFGLDN